MPPDPLPPGGIVLSGPSSGPDSEHGGRPVAPPYIVGAMRIDVRYTLSSGQAVQNVLHAVLPEDFDPSGAAGDIASIWQTEIMPFLTNNVLLAEVQVTDYSEAGGETGAVSAAVVGGSASAPLPPNCAIALSWRTGRSGRSFRGRTYLPGIGEDKVSGGGVIDSGFVAALNGAGTDLLVALSGAGYPLIVASRLLGTGEIISSCIVDNIVDTQRRRLR